jgi:hypothetical protein
MIPLYSKILTVPFDNIYRKNLCLDLIERHKKTLYGCTFVPANFELLSRTNKLFLTGGFNFQISNDHDNFTAYLYTVFENMCYNIFDNMQLSPGNIFKSYAYVTNKSEDRFNIHNHKRTSTINGVYYLKVPCKDSGKLNFYDNDQNLIYSHQPIEDEFVIFPNYLNHNAELSESDDYRIAINVEFFVPGEWQIPKDYSVKTIYLD